VLGVDYDEYIVISEDMGVNIIRFLLVVSEYWDCFVWGNCLGVFSMVVIVDYELFGASWGFLCM
jgi:hypothetical protein